jgi:hypothetical protein
MLIYLGLYLILLIIAIFSPLADSKAAWFDADYFHGLTMWIVFVAITLAPGRILDGAVYVFRCALSSERIVASKPLRDFAIYHVPLWFCAYVGYAHLSGQLPL